MASPFRYFRKHTKAFMATAAVLAIGLFVFGSAVGSGGGGGEDRRTPAATVATWNGGSLNEGELESLIQQRLITNEFLQRLAAQGGARSEYDLQRTGVPNFLLPSTDLSYLQEQVVYTELFASLATQAGMSVDDAMVNYYLQKFGFGRVGTEEIRGLLRTAGAGNVRDNVAIVFSTLRKLLLSSFYHAAYEDSSQLVLPQQRWEDWRRVNERISVQAAVLPVENFLAQTPEPTEAQLRTLYDQYREAEPDQILSVMGQELPSPNPGFAVPRRVKVHYLAGQLAQRTEKLLPTVTEAEIADYYERNKRLEFTKDAADELEDFGAGLNDPAASEDAPADPAATDPAGTDPTATDPAATDPAATEPAATAPAPAGETSPSPSGEPAPSEPASPGQPAATDPAAAAPASPGEAATDGDQSSVGRRSPFRLAALQTAPAADDPADNPAAATDAAAAPPAGSGPADGEAADAEPADAEPAEGPAPTDSANPAGGANPLRAGVDAADSAAGPAAPAADGAEPATPPSTPAADTPQSNGPDAAKPADPEADAAGADAAAAIDPGAAADAPVEYLPLEEVTELIRNRLAQEKAVTALQQQLSEATAKLQSAYNQYGRAAVESRELKRKAPRPPAKLANLQWLADAYGLTYETTGALTYMQLNELPVGKAVDDQSGRVNLAAAAFTSLDLYEPFLAHDSLGGDWYLAAKIEDAPRRVPPFDEVRDKVAVAWRRIEAAKLAEKAAKDLAKELETSAEPFGEFFKAKGYEVVPQTAMFSWRTYLFGPENGQPAQLSDVPELKNVGPDFMEAAFSLKDGEKAIGLLNFDRSSAYVIRLAARQYTPDELKSLFLREANSWLGRPMMQRERSLTFRRSMQTHLAEEIAGFKFDEQWIERREKALAAERQ